MSDTTVSPMNVGRRDDNYCVVPSFTISYTIVENPRRHTNRFLRFFKRRTSGALVCTLTSRRQQLRFSFVDLGPSPLSPPPSYTQWTCLRLIHARTKTIMAKTQTRMVIIRIRLLYYMIIFTFLPSWFLIKYVMVIGMKTIWILKTLRVVGII